MGRSWCPSSAWLRPLAGLRARWRAPGCRCLQPYAAAARPGTATAGTARQRCEDLRRANPLMRRLSKLLGASRTSTGQASSAGTDEGSESLDQSRKTDSAASSSQPTKKQGAKPASTDSAFIGAVGDSSLMPCIETPSDLSRACLCMPATPAAEWVAVLRVVLLCRCQSRALCSHRDLRSHRARRCGRAGPSRTDPW